MRNLIGWIVIIVALVVAWQAGWLNSIVNYFTNSMEMSGKEQVIHEADGSTTTVKYRNVFDILLNK